MAIEWQAPKGLYWIEGNKFIQSFQQLIQILCAGHPLSLLSSCSPSDKAKNWESPYVRKGETGKSEMPYK
jgi:hypothetical protein